MNGSRVVAAFALTAAVACAPGADTPRAAPTTSPPATLAPGMADVEAVRAALARTRAAGTAHYVLVAASRDTQGTFSVRREGAYDTTARLASIETTMHADPPLLATQMGFDPEQLVVRNVVAKSDVYLQMPGWKPPANTRWVRFANGDVPAEAGTVDIKASIVPEVMEMLDRATPRERIGQPGTARIDVPASAVFLAYPVGAFTGELVKKGVDPDKLQGVIPVDVTITDGFVAQVSFDALPAFTEAYEQIDQPELGAGTTSMRTDLTVSGHGEPVRIVVPSGRQVMTDAEFERLAG